MKHLMRSFKFHFFSKRMIKGTDTAQKKNVYHFSTTINHDPLIQPELMRLFNPIAEAY